MDYRHKVKIQLRFADTDMLGHVNNSNFLTYMEVARMSYFKEVLGNAIDWKKEGIILAKATVEYKVPLFIEDDLYVEIKIDHISSKSFNISYRFIKMNTPDKVVAALGTTLMVCYNYYENKSIVMPALWREKISCYEGMSLLKS
ncbi:MAG: acyl-CoA thioesterase [Flavobacteriales bacterium]|nr:acyl-CoA thioesterase [Flavobacteriales bacterium]